MNRSDLTWRLGLISIVWATVSAHAGVNVPAPCDDSGTQGLRTCQHLLFGHDPLLEEPPSGATTRLEDPGMIEILRRRFQRQIEALYGLYPNAPPDPIPPDYSAVPVQHEQGIAFDVNAIGGAPGRAFGPFGKWVCNSIGVGADASSQSPMYIPPEINSSTIGGHSCGQLAGEGKLNRLTFAVPLSIQISNHLDVDDVNDAGNRCGPDPADPDKTKCVSGSGESPWITCITGAHVPSTRINMTAPAGTHETALLQGSYASNLACFYSAKIHELKQIANAGAAVKQFTIEDLPFGGSSGPSECLAQAKALTLLSQDVTQSFGRLLTDLKNNGGSGSQYADIANCKLNQDNDPSSLNDPRISGLRQQAQHLCAMRANVEEAFIRLAECQVFALAQRAWRNVIVDKLPEFWQGQLQKAVGNNCGKYCKYFVTHSVFRNPGNVSQSQDFGSKIGAAWTALDCFTCGTWLRPGCHPREVGSPCDLSAKCPVLSPYPPENDLATFETLAHNGQTQTESKARDDINSCINQCYESGVSGGYIKSTPPARTASLHQTIFVPPGNPEAGPGSAAVPTEIPSYTEQITKYLSAQWPRATVTSINECALAGPKSP